MTQNFKTNVHKTDIEFLSDGSVALKSNGLLNTLVHSAPHAIEKLANDVGLISIDDVSIDDHGRIVIANARFVEALKSKISKATAAGDTNYVCKNAYKCTTA